MVKIHDSKGYFKMHWELWSLLDDDYMAVLLAEYIIGVYPALKECKEIDGVIYKRLSDSFIQERISITNPTINKYLAKLEKAGLIKVCNANYVKGARYIKLDVKVISIDEE